MQPQGPYSPGPTPPSADYSFLNEQPKRNWWPFKNRFNFSGQSWPVRLAIAVGTLILLIIIILVIKGLLSSPPYNQTDYLSILNTQEEMIHILNSDLTSANSGQLTSSQQNFAATANASLATSQASLLSFLASNGDKISTSALTNVYSSSIDSQFQSALAANNLDSFFASQMSDQLDLYKSRIKTAYYASNDAAGRDVLRAAYNQVPLLVRALNSPAS